MADQGPERGFHLAGLSFVADLSGQVTAANAPEGAYILRKSDRTIEFYRGLARRRPRHVLEIGMREGGSLPLWDALFAPHVLVGLDPRHQPIDAVERYRAERPHVRTYYGRNPDKPGTVMAARESFAGGPDLVIDDASHRYETTRTTFANLFPLLQTGGTYVVEGWNWAHRPGAQDEGHAHWGERALTGFLFELVILAASHRVIEHVHVEEGLFAVRKGPGVLPPGALDAPLPTRGRDLPAL